MSNSEPVSLKLGNLIDWNTLKNIKNKTSLKIEVPASKKQEFIRAIE
jgi:hypothetical protein